jgi:hypothetical protein
MKAILFYYRKLSQVDTTYHLNQFVDNKNWLKAENSFNRSDHHREMV